MSWLAHRRLLGGLLVAITFPNIWVSIVMLQTLDEFRDGDFPRIILQLVFVAIWLTIGMLVFQIVGGTALMIRPARARAVGLGASIVAIFLGISLPVGVYGLWVLASSCSSLPIGPSD